MALPSRVLLDTCAVIWFVNGDPMVPHAIQSIVAAGLSAGILVSPVSAWEIGMLSKPRSGRSPLMTFSPDPKTWFRRFLAQPGIKDAALTPDIAIDAAALPGDLHPDPGDRLLIATARHQQAPIVTRDRKIIAYAQAGHIDVIEC